MRTTRDFKYYVKMYLVALIVYLGYVSYLAYQDGGFDVTLLLGAAYIPLMFILFMYVFDRIFDKIFPPKEKKQADAYKTFVKNITQIVDNELSFSLEEFKRLRENEKFQKALFHAYQITEHGETEQINFVFLEKKFRKDTNEAKAMEIIIREVKKMM
ncbi:MAG: hypothetical protein K9L26_00095 [Candidatus Izimaplasma sp.]|nr:hypothetical protein [Candidatus Izimaplasma bacterium]